MKKKMMLLGILFMIMAVATPVYAQNLTDACTNISTEIDVKIPDLVHKIILVIQIAVPVILVIFGMLDLFKGLTAQKEDEIKKGQQKKDSIMKCASCFVNGVNTKNGECETW